MDNLADFAHIFLVEDDVDLASLVADYFTLQGFKITVEGRGDRALERILATQPDVVILDLMLPGKSGLDVCRELRTHSDVPVLMLTALTDDVDQIVGLEVGADDYICKPVQPRLLLARVNAMLRRTQNTENEKSSDNNQQKSHQFGQLSINETRQTVIFKGDDVELTTSELSLLCLLAQHAGQVLSRDEISSRLRGFGYDGLDRTVDMLVSKLRRKLGDNATKPEKIKTIWKRGYLFDADAWND